MGELVDLTRSDSDRDQRARFGTVVRGTHASAQTYTKEPVIVLSDDDDDQPLVALSKYDHANSKSAPAENRAAYDTNRQMARSISNGVQEPRGISTPRNSPRNSPLSTSDSGRAFTAPRQRQHPRDEPNYWKEKKNLIAESQLAASEITSGNDAGPIYIATDFQRQVSRAKGALDYHKRPMAARKSSQQSHHTLGLTKPVYTATSNRESVHRKRKRSSGEQLVQSVKSKGPRLSSPDSSESRKFAHRVNQNSTIKSNHVSYLDHGQINDHGVQSFPEAQSRSADSNKISTRFTRKPFDRRDESNAWFLNPQKRSEEERRKLESSQREISPSEIDESFSLNGLKQKTSTPLENSTFKIPERPASEKPNEKSLLSRSDERTSEPTHFHESDKDTSQIAVPSMTSDEVTEIPLTFEFTENLLKRHLNELKDDQEQFVRSWLGRARQCFQPITSTVAAPVLDLSKGPTKVKELFVHSSSPFLRMKPVSTRSSGKGSEKGNMSLIQDVMFDKSTNHKSNRTYLSVQSTRLKHEKLSIPEYTSYVGLRQNVLAENDQTLLYWPYMGETADESTLHEELEDKFNVSIEDRHLHLERIAQSKKYEPYVQNFLDELGCSANDVVRFLLEPTLPKSTLLSENVRQAVVARDKSCQDDFDRSSIKWVLVLSRLPASSDRALAAAALACYSFLDICKFSLWHVMQQIICRESEAQNINDASALDNVFAFKNDFQYRDVACRICHLHNCNYHGEYRETPRSSNEARRIDSELHSASVELSVDGEDAVRINFKKLVNVQPRRSKLQRAYSPSTRSIIPRRGHSYWIQKSNTHLIHDREPFYPCSHEGSCEEEQCRCFRMKITCEKSCACSADCERRFRGCQCAQKGKVCFQNAACDCYRLNRECDEDLCGTCGAVEVLDPINRYNKEIAKGKCANVHIQRNLPKRTLLGHSEVQGFGLYMGEPVKAHEYIGEYKGEVITKSEADRRGAIYAHLATNYLFSLNKEQEVDSTKAGNKMRFVNNSEREDTMNCYAQTMLCNSVPRIGMYARRDVAIGEELFFNYGYPKTITKHFWEKGEKAKKPSGTSQGKWRASTVFISDAEDVSTTSAVGKSAAASSRGKEKWRLDKDGNLVKRKSNAGGARPGAGRKPKNRPPPSLNVGIIPPNPSTSSAAQLKDRGKEKGRLATLEQSPSRAPSTRRTTAPSPWKGWRIVEEPEPERDVFEHRDETQEEHGGSQGEAGAEEETPAPASIEDSDADSEYHDEEEILPRRRRRRGWRKATRWH